MDGQYFLDLLFKIVEGVLVAAAPLIVGLVAAWLKAKIDLVKTRAASELSDQQRWLLKVAANVAVDAAEQMKLANLIEDKKEYAIVAAQDYLNAHGININVSVVEAAIEAAVLGLNGNSA
jgi:hypothetical protein